MISSNMNKNAGKYLAAILAMMMVVVGAAVVLSDEASAEDMSATDFLALDTDKDKVISLTEDKSVTGTIDLTGYTVNLAAHVLTFNNATVTGGIVNAQGISSTNGGNAVLVSGTTSFTNTIFNDKTNTQATGNPNAYFLVNTAGNTDLTFTGCDFTTDVEGNWGAIMLGDGSDLTLNSCEIGADGKVLYRSGTVALVNTSINLQITGTKTVNLDNFTLDEQSKILKTYIGWGENDSSYKTAQSDVKNEIKFENSGSDAVDIGEIVKGDDPNSTAVTEATNTVKVAAEDSTKVDFTTAENSGLDVTYTTDAGTVAVTEWTPDETNGKIMTAKANTTYCNLVIPEDGKFVVSVTGVTFADGIVNNGTIVLDGFDISILAGVTVTNNGDITSEKGNSIVLNGENGKNATLVVDGSVSAKIKDATGVSSANTSNESTGTLVDLVGLTGDYTISHGSVLFVDGSVYTGGTIKVDHGDVKISGTIAGDVSIIRNDYDNVDITVTFEKIAVNNGGKLILDGSLNYTVSHSTTANGQPVVDGYFYLYGTIVPYDEKVPATITVASKNTFRAYAGAQLSSDVTVEPVAGVTDAVIDLSQAQSTLTVSQDVVASVEYGQLQSIVIDGVLSIRNNSTLTIQGDLVISEGTILTIEDGSKLVVNGNVATVSVDGTIDILDGGEFRVIEADDVAIAGSVNSYGKVFVNSTVAINEGGVVRINEGDESSIEVVGGMTVDAGGELIVSDNMAIQKIENKGTVTLSGAVLTATSNVTGGSTISLTAAGAVVNIVSVTAATDGLTLTINDSGLKFPDNGRTVEGKKITHVVGEKFNDEDVNANSIVITLNKDCGVSGLTITEAVSGNGSEKTPYVNDMYFAGTVGFVYVGEKEVDALTKPIAVDGDRLYVSDALTLVAGIKMSVAGTMDVIGIVTAIAEDSSFDIVDGGEVTVSGLIQLIDENKLSGDELKQINAAYYSVVGSGTTPTYHYYTNFVDAVAANPATVYVYGVVTVLEDVTVPSPMVIRNEGTLVIGSTENRDVTVTVANGASFRSGTVEVFGTLYFENKRNDSITTPISDVRIEGDADRTYTNIYTALNDAEAGETVTITREGTVWLDSDLTIKTGVILDVPNTKYIGLDAGVTLTVDGTLRTAHPVQVRIDANTVGAGNFAVEASNSSVDGYASAIVVNGTFMSMADMPYADVEGQQGYQIPGAYYTVIDSNGIYNYITPVEAASAVSANAVDGAFTINGKVTSGDVTFTGTDVQPVSVTVSNGSEYTAASITLVGATLKTVGTGLFNGTVVVGDASIDAYKAKLLVDSEDGLTVWAAVREVDEKDGKTVISTLNIATGTVMVGGVSSGMSYSVDGDVTVDEGATLTVPAKASGLITGKLTVNGTVAVGNAQRLTVTGDLFVNGTATVAAASDAGAAGTLYVGTNTDNERKGTMYVGLDAKFATTGATATVTGIVNVPTIYAVAGATVDAEIVEDMDTTAYYVEGTVWINAYGDGDLVMPNMKNAPVENAYFNNVWQNADETAKYSDEADAENDVETSTIGTPEAVYAIVEYDVYVINLRADQNAVSSISIDGSLMQFGMIGNAMTGYYYGYTAVVDAGAHTIQYQLANGYSGQGVLTVNGTQQSGLTFTTEGNPTEAQGGKITYNLQLTGFEKSGYVPDSPDTSSDSGDSGMTITDYLLIVLVVLIIVMAIIVAMRLMRS